MIIVEGTDGVGKTTLCKKLLEALPTHIYSHFTRLPSNFDYYWGYVDRMSRNIVQDRFHMSEIAYARARSEEPKLGIGGYKLIDAKLRLLGTMTIVVIATDELVKKRWDSSQMYNVDITIKAQTTYRRIAEDSGHTWKDFDQILYCNEETPYATQDSIDRILAEYSHRQAFVDEIAKRRTASI